MRHRLWVALVVLALGCGMSAKVKRLSPREAQHYYALKVWMNEDERWAFLSQKTQETRDAWLKEHGFWDRFYQYDDATRKAIIAGDVAVGFRLDQVFMAWGEPHARTKLVGRDAERSELLVYRFEVDKNGNVLVWTPDSKTTYKAEELYQVRVTVDDQVVTQVEETEGWE